MLPDALKLRRQLMQSTGVGYSVMRSGRRSVGVTPFYVKRDA
jgi:hypothetical protein